jgi:hypothetical protein
MRMPRVVYAASGRTNVTFASSPFTYSDEKGANRDIRVWHLVIENGY